MTNLTADSENNRRGLIQRPDCASVSRDYAGCDVASVAFNISDCSGLNEIHNEGQECNLSGSARVFTTVWIIIDARMCLYAQLEFKL